MRADFAKVFFIVAGQRLSESVADQHRKAYESGEACGA
jgi:hypothetical protein